MRLTPLLGLRFRGCSKIARTVVDFTKKGGGAEEGPRARSLSRVLTATLIYQSGLVLLPARSTASEVSSKSR
jgi:hypothetical protein